MDTDTFNIRINKEVEYAIEEGRAIAHDESVKGYSDMEDLRVALEV